MLWRVEHNGGRAELGGRSLQVCFGQPHCGRLGSDPNGLRDCAGPLLDLELKCVYCTGGLHFVRRALGRQ